MQIRTGLGAAISAAVAAVALTSGVALAVAPTAGDWTDTGEQGVYKQIAFRLVDAGQSESGVACPADAASLPCILGLTFSHTTRCQFGTGRDTSLTWPSSWPMRKVAGGPPGFTVTDKFQRPKRHSLQVTGTFTSSTTAAGTASWKWRCRRRGRGVVTSKKRIHWHVSLVGAAGPRG